MDIDISLNNFAIRCFRDNADKDYITARLCYRNGLVPQFHWQALQAIEKYFKAILLFNRIEARNIGHDLCRALELTENLPFELDLDETTIDLIRHLNKFGPNRYLEKSYYIFGSKLTQLDQAVWEIRRYCKVLNYEKRLLNGQVLIGLDFELEAIRKSRNMPFHKFTIIGGELERIIQNKNHLSRDALVWKNSFFGEKKRNSNECIRLYASENTPLDMYPPEPELLEQLNRYIHLPNQVIQAYEARLRDDDH